MPKSTRWVIAFALGACRAIGAAAAPSEPAPADFQWGTRIPLRDGVELQAMLYRPPGQSSPLPCLLTLTPYTAQAEHEAAVYFATHGYVFAAVDVRGRGNSGGEFAPFRQEAQDGYDVVEWLAQQPYCNGRVGMWGASYLGYSQWATAKEFPMHLASIAPTAPVQPGLDFPLRSNMFRPYAMRWLTFVSGHTLQETMFGDLAWWAQRFRQGFDAHAPLATLDVRLGNPSPIFREWVAHPHQDAYWDSLSPTAQEYARIDLPILTVTGQYDADQPGALAFYRSHNAYASATAKAKHYLVIGPWDHRGTAEPRAQIRGLTFGAASLVDMNALHRDWYDWTLKAGPKPDFLKKPVAYFVAGREEWRYADTLEAITGERRALYLASDGGRANSVFASGNLVTSASAVRGGSDRYRYDPLDVSSADVDVIEATDRELIDQRRVLADRGKHLVYHSEPLAADTEISGFFKLDAWIAIDQPDTDFGVAIYAIAPDGSSVLLSSDRLRARYRESPRAARFATPGKIERYAFDSFTFVARLLTKGSRLRTVIGPVNSLHAEKNYNSAGIVAEESGPDARTVTATLHHDREHASVLYVPLARSAADAR
jgi:putative CocE/NonD family hydrolase